MPAESVNFTHANVELEKNLAGVFSNFGLRALVIDDNPANIRLLTQQLNYLGCQVDSGNSGVAGLELWQLHKHTIVIVDCRMPGMDGKEVISQIINDSCYEIGLHRIIAYSADTSKHIDKEYVNAGADFFACKPIALVNLHKLILRCVKRPSGELITESNLVALKFVVSNLPVEDTAASEKQNLTDVKIINVDYMDEILGDDPCRQATHKHLAEMFSKQAPDVLSGMIAANDLHDSVQLGHLVHKFKSSARSIGADRVAAACASLEELIPTNNYSEMAKSLQEFDGYLQEVIAYWVAKSV